VARSASAHRLDEYLQATLLGPTPLGTEVEIQLTPGVAVLPVVLAVIDQDGDGRISPAEERAYVARVAREVELRVDAAAAPLSLVESTFPAVEAMREGLGAIRLRFRSTRSGHTIYFENRHLPQVSAYLVNCLADPSNRLSVTRQARDEQQRSIELDYSFGAGAVWGGRFWPLAIGTLLVARQLWCVATGRRRERSRSSISNRLRDGFGCSSPAGPRISRNV
jgi:hypothetical protein